MHAWLMMSTTYSLNKDVSGRVTNWLAPQSETFTGLIHQDGSVIICSAIKPSSHRSTDWPPEWNSCLIVCFRYQWKDVRYIEIFITYNSLLPLPASSVIVFRGASSSSVARTVISCNRSSFLEFLCKHLTAGEYTPRNIFLAFRRFVEGGW